MNSSRSWPSCQRGDGQEAVARTARALMPLVDKASDEPTADLITLPRQIHENNAWMLCSLLEE